MDNIEQKLEQIEELIKNIGGLGLALPKLPKPPTPDMGVKPVTAAPTTTKNPVNVAQQIKDPSTKKIAVKAAKNLIKFDSNGQWKLEEK